MVNSTDYSLTWEQVGHAHARRWHRQTGDAKQADIRRTWTNLSHTNTSKTRWEIKVFLCSTWDGSTLDWCWKGRDWCKRTDSNGRNKVCDSENCLTSSFGDTRQKNQIYDLCTNPLPLKHVQSYNCYKSSYRRIRKSSRSLMADIWNSSRMSLVSLLSFTEENKSLRTDCLWSRKF